MDKNTLDLNAHVTALELVVRGLFTKWAEQAPDPKESVFRITEAMVGSLHSVTENAPPEHLEFISQIENHLRRIGEQVAKRLPE
ncbi:MAG: hypothetical protein M9932_11685 [Xanthobacteraceae bacterium]|nr:hypothetical protein [Xanthobacteraceae bacterium]